MLAAKRSMSARTYKITTVVLFCVVVWLAWTLFASARHLIIARFVSFQAVHLREDIDLASANAVVSRNAGALTTREDILRELNWYLGYYDSYTNTLAHSPYLSFLKIE